VRSGDTTYLCTPVMRITQLYNSYSLPFFVRLWVETDKKGNLSIFTNDKGNLMIGYTLKGWKSFFSVFIPLSQVYMV